MFENGAGINMEIIQKCRLDGGVWQIAHDLTVCGSRPVRGSSWGGVRVVWSTQGAETKGQKNILNEEVYLQHLTN